MSRFAVKDQKLYLILFVSLIAFFTPFIILSLFNHPGTDDYIIGARVRDEGFWTYQHNAYYSWSGRYFYNFSGSIFSLNDFVFKHYYFHPLFLLLLSLLSIYFLFSTVNKFFLKSYYTRVQVIIAACIYLVILVCSYAEVSTAFFWFSSAITYQLPVALFYAGIGFSIRSAYAAFFYQKLLYGLAAVFCIIAINGANEMVALSLGVFMLIGAFIIFQFYPNQKRAIVIYFIIYLLSFIVLAISPGSRERAAEIPSAGLLNACGFAFARTLYTFWNIFKEPLFWLFGLFIFSQSQIISERLRLLQFPVFTFLPKYKKWLLIVPVVVVMINYLPLIYLSNGSLPERATNSVIFFTLLLVTALIVIFGVLYSNKAILPQITLYFLVAGIALTILCNRLFFSMLQNVVSGFFYDKVMTAREAELSEALKRPNKKAVVYSYDTSLQQQIKYYFPAGTRKQVEELITRKPEHLFLFDDLATDYNLKFLKEYYRLDTIAVIKKVNDKN
jgi:branched-subunit amino acid transport protein